MPATITRSFISGLRALGSHSAEVTRPARRCFGRFAAGRPCIARRDEHRNEEWELQVHELSMRFATKLCPLPLRGSTGRSQSSARYRIRKNFCLRLRLSFFSTSPLRSRAHRVQLPASRALIFPPEFDNDFMRNIFWTGEKIRRLHACVACRYILNVRLSFPRCIEKFTECT